MITITEEPPAVDPSDPLRNVRLAIWFLSNPDGAVPTREFDMLIRLLGEAEERGNTRVEALQDDLAEAVKLLRAAGDALTRIDQILYTSRHDRHHVDEKSCQPCQAMLLARATAANIDAKGPTT